MRDTARIAIKDRGYNSVEKQDDGLSFACFFSKLTMEIVSASRGGSVFPRKLILHTGASILPRFNVLATKRASYCPKIRRELPE